MGLKLAVKFGNLMALFFFAEGEPVDKWHLALTIIG